MSNLLHPIKPKKSASRAMSATIPDCRTEVQLIADYLTGNLAPRRRLAFEKHLGDCRDCTAFLQTYKKTLVLTSAFLKHEASQPALSFAALRAQGR